MKNEKVILSDTKKKDRAAKVNDKKKDLSGKSFAELTNKQKDDLLKVLLLEHGMLDDNDVVI